MIYSIRYVLSLSLCIAHVCDLYIRWAPPLPPTLGLEGPGLQLYDTSVNTGVCEINTLFDSGACNVGERKHTKSGAG